MMQAIESYLPLRPTLVVLGTASVITMLALGALAFRGQISSSPILGTAHLAVGSIGVISFITLAYISEGGNGKNKGKKWILTALLVANACAIAIIGVATLKGGAGLQLTFPLSVTAGKGMLFTGSGLLLFGGATTYFSHHSSPCYR